MRSHIGIKTRLNAFKLPNCELKRIIFRAKTQQCLISLSTRGKKLVIDPDSRSPPGREADHCRTLYYVFQKKFLTLNHATFVTQLINSEAHFNKLSRVSVVSQQC